MTGTSMNYDLSMAFTEYLPNKALAQIADACMQEIGAPKWTEEDYRLARQFLDSYDDTARKMIRDEIIQIYGEDRLLKFCPNL